MDPRIRYCVQLKKISQYPDSKRIRAETRFLLIKDFEDRFLRGYKKEKGVPFLKKEATKIFCEQQGVALRTFYRWVAEYRRHGIEGLLPEYGAREPKPQRGMLNVTLQMDPKNPLACLRQLRAAIHDNPAITAEKSKEAVEFLDAELRMLRRRSGLSLGRDLSEVEILRLTKYRSSTHKNHSAKAIIILMANEGRSMQEVMRASRRSHRSVYRCIQTFNRKGLDFIETNPIPEVREKVWRQRKIRTISILHGSPRLYGLNRTTWTSPTIREAYRRTYDEELPRWALKRIIKEAGYKWKRAVQVLTSKDPEYKEKLARLLVTLQTLKKGEVFFSVDEAGPWRVKKYGGKALVHRDTIRTIPEFQTSKGAINLISALELTSNQVESLFIARKDASAVVRLLEFLKGKYSHVSKIFLTWDAVAAHRSSAVNQWLDETNRKALEEKSGPTFEIVPLPSNAQWLNVIESVFSGLRKAIIHNSDYASKEEMETAIRGYFEERNAYYKENPRRAGKKIWEKEIFTLEELPGGLFRRM